MKQLFRPDGLAAMALADAVRSFSMKHEFSNRTVLDVGCGTMPYRSMFTQRQARYIGADIDGTPDIVINAEGTLPLADESVDFVVSFQVLEHVRNVAAYLATLRRVLRVGGSVSVNSWRVALPSAPNGLLALDSGWAARDAGGCGVYG